MEEGCGGREGGCGTRATARLMAIADYNRGCADPLRIGALLSRRVHGGVPPELQSENMKLVTDNQTLSLYLYGYSSHDSYQFHTPGQNPGILTNTKPTLSGSPWSAQLSRGPPRFGQLSMVRSALSAVR